MLDRIVKTRHFHISSSFHLQNKSVFQRYVCEFSRKHETKHRDHLSWANICRCILQNNCSIHHRGTASITDDHNYGKQRQAALLITKILLFCAQQSLMKAAMFVTRLSVLDIISLSY